MITYKILETKQNEENIITKVEYDFSGTKVTVDIPHFMASTLEEITTGIENRAISEQRKLEAIATNEDLLKEIKVGEVISI